MVDEIWVGRKGSFELSDCGAMPALPQQGPSQRRVCRSQPRVEFYRRLCQFKRAIERSRICAIESQPKSLALHARASPTSQIDYHQSRRRSIHAKLKEEAISRALYDEEQKRPARRHQSLLYGTP